MKNIEKIRPCDCKDLLTVSRLQEQAITVNDNFLMVEPNVVVLRLGHTKVRIPQAIFKKFADWYLQEQDAIESVLPTMKTSEHWYQELKITHNLIIYDSDGWDRKNFQYSFYEEKISFEEFHKRCMTSTISADDSFYTLID